MVSETLLLRARSALWMTAAVGGLLAVLLAVSMAARWPLVHDAPLLHYVIFLMEHGKAPYRDIVEINMPGSYITEWTVMHTLGGDARGWFLWDVLTGLATIYAAAIITGPGCRSAGIFAGSIAYLFHLQDGALDLGQRDWVVAALLLSATACIVHWLRIRKRAPTSNLWVGVAVSLCGVAASIKPPVILVAFVLLAVVVHNARKRGESGASSVLWAFAGAVPPLLATAGFLAYWHVWREFFDALHGLLPYYAGLQVLPYSLLLHRALPLSLVPFTLGAGFLFLATRSWTHTRTHTESILLLNGAVLGLGLFLLQRKGWTYHRYTLIVFLLVWCAVQIERAFQSDALSLRVAGGALLLGMLLYLPVHCLNIERRSAYPMDVLDHLQRDLARLGGADLSGHIQCLDMAQGGCINTLYRMQLVQSTGFIYDFALFPKRDTPITRSAQSRFMAEIAAAPPKVFVLSSQIWPGDRFGYDEVERWPRFQQFLAAHYTLAASYGRDALAPSVGYRTYLKNNE